MASATAEDDFLDLAQQDTDAAYDVFNDDTFGEGAEAWQEEAHEQLAKLSEDERLALSRSNEFFDFENKEGSAAAGLLEPLEPPPLNGNKNNGRASSDEAVFLDPLEFEGKLQIENGKSPPPPHRTDPAILNVITSLPLPPQQIRLPLNSHGHHLSNPPHIDNGLLPDPAVMSMRNVPPPILGVPPLMPTNLQSYKGITQIEEEMVRSQLLVQQLQQQRRQQSEHEISYRHHRHHNQRYHQYQQQQHNETFHRQYQQRPFKYRNNDDRNRYNDRNRETFGDDMVDSHRVVNNLIMPGHVHVLGILRGGRNRVGGTGTGNPQLDLLRDVEPQTFTSSTSPFDEYSGLMSQKERSWIINIQLSQLKCENPFIDDYYYTVYNQKKTKEKADAECQQQKRTDEGPQLLLSESFSEDSAMDRARSYTPKQFSNSLGKIQAVTVKAPRKLLDIGLSNNDLLDGNFSLAQKDSRKFKQTLMELERLYSLLIEVEDCEKKLGALPTNTTLRNQVQHERLEATNSLGANLTANLRRYLLVRKGKTLISRALRHIDENRVQMVMATLCQLFPTAIKRDREDQLLPSRLWPELKKHLEVSSASLLLHYLALLNASAAASKCEKITGLSTFKLTLTTSLGTAFITSILALLNSMELDDEELEERDSLLGQLVEAITEINEITIPQQNYFRKLPTNSKFLSSNPKAACQIQRLISF